MAANDGLTERVQADREMLAEVRAARLAEALAGPDESGDEADRDEAAERQASKDARKAAEAAEVGRALRRDIRASDRQDALRAAINEVEDPGPEAVNSATLRRALRESFGVSLRELATTLGVSVEAVTRYENIDGGASDAFHGPVFRRALAVFAQNAAEKEHE